jgi:agmatine/peptidylarginine deiminase
LGEIGPDLGPAVFQIGIPTVVLGMQKLIHLRFCLILLALSALVPELQAQKHHILPDNIRLNAESVQMRTKEPAFPLVFDFRKAVPSDKSTQANGEAWLPGEFEESQAVVLSWGEYDGEDIDTTSNLAEISAQLCIGIQPEAQVWIRIFKASDSLPVKRYMANIGHPLYNHRFLVKHGDNWWARDYGPIGYYFSEQDSLGFADFKYYPGREHDNVVPATVSYKNGWQHRVTPLNFEGGNLIADGFGTVFYSNVVQQANTATGTHFPTMNAATVADSMRRVLKANTVVQLPALSCDGGTGHLDLYLKMMDEETWIAGQYPSVITASDRTLSESNITLIKNRNSVYNRPFRVFRLPLPTDNNGTYNQQLTCNGLNNFGRSFINGITVNKTFIYPIWDSETSGNTTQRLQVEANLKKWFPGLKPFGIDVRAMTGFGGQLHCITMQIPADNPVKIWHPALRDQQVIRPEFRLQARIQNRSGVDTALCRWRVGSQGIWHEMALEDSAGYHIAAIPGDSVAVGDTVQYYIKALTNNGKEAYKPIFAPEGYFEFVVTSPLSALLQEMNTRYRIVPNAGSGSFYLEGAEEAGTRFRIFDATGRLLREGTIEQGTEAFEIPVQSLPHGLYRLWVSAPNQFPVVLPFARF